jgi:hypothetical protein
MTWRANSPLDCLAEPPPVAWGFCTSCLGHSRYSPRSLSNGILTGGRPGRFTADRRGWAGFSPSSGRTPPPIALRELVGPPTCGPLESSLPVAGAPRFSLPATPPGGQSLESAPSEPHSQDPVHQSLSPLLLLGEGGGRTLPCQAIIGLVGRSAFSVSVNP